MDFPPVRTKREYGAHLGTRDPVFYVLELLELGYNK